MRETKLYRGTFEGVVYFVADDDKDAEKMIQHYVCEEVKSNGCCAEVAGSDLEEINGYCYSNCIPWGEENDKTIGEYLDELQAAEDAKKEQELQDRLQMKMFAEVSE